MTSRGLPAAVRRLLAIAVTAVIATMTLTWVPVTKVAGFELQLPYLAAMVLAGLIVVFPAGIAHSLRNMPPAVLLCLSAYGTYLVVLQFGLSGGDGKGMVARQVFFLTCGSAFALGLVAVRAAPSVLRAGGILAILGFVVFSEVLSWQLGLSWITVIQTLATTGNFDFVFYQFLKQMFELVLPAGVEAQASDKNAVSVAILIALFLYRAGWQGKGQDRAGQLVTLLTLAVLVVLNTRSVLMLAAICLPLAAWIAMVRHGIRDRGEFVLKTLIFLGLAVVAVVLSSLHSGSTSAFGDRFSFDDDSTGKRFEQYAWALARIEANPWLGAGPGEYKGQPVHNLFLGAWMHAGILAFGLVVFAYLTVAVTWLAFLLRTVTQRGYWLLPVRAEWVAVLPLLPLFRVWIAGDAGHPSFVEWTTLFAFFGLLSANRLRRLEGPIGPSETSQTHRGKIARWTSPEDMESTN